MTDKPLYEQLAEIGASKPEAWDEFCSEQRAINAEDHRRADMLDAVTISREKLQAAIDALEHITASETFYKDPRGDTAGPAIDALRAALATEPVEPVAVVRTVGHKGASVDWFAGLGEECSVGDLLYAAAPAAVPLTDEEIDATICKIAPLDVCTADHEWLYEFARAILAAGDKP